MNTEQTFVSKHNLWTDDKYSIANELKRRVDTEALHLIRLAWVDSHGAVRAKALTPQVFKDSLDNGYNINVATSTLDGAGGRVFSSFTQGGGMELDEMTGSPNLVAVPDPDTFHILPWAPGIGWVLCDQYFKNGMPFHFCTRHLLKSQLARLANQNLQCLIGLEIEWYLALDIEPQLSEVHVGGPGIRGQAIKTRPVEIGYSYHSETNLDLMQPILSELACAYKALDMPLRSMENEWGPGQLECTFSAQDALKAADNFVLMRTATRQICRRKGYFATFMCKPALKGYYPSGWHLHQSLVDACNGRNVFTPDSSGEILSQQGRQWLAGLLHHAVDTIIFTTPTINGYRRFVKNSLAPDRISWGVDHRGTMIRVLSGEREHETRLENRTGEPSANPYLYIASQIAAGLDGMDRDLSPPLNETDPYKADHRRLPDNLASALDAVTGSKLMRKQFGDIFIDYFIKLKQAELQRYNNYNEIHGNTNEATDVTQWEQDEYFDFF
ncbi:MAG: glutamine synthetase [Gammaproteobacteria bacterium]|jgi:glutamine synthetase